MLCNHQISKKIKNKTEKNKGLHVLYLFWCLQRLFIAYWKHFDIFKQVPSYFKLVSLLCLAMYVYFANRQYFCTTDAVVMRYFSLHIGQREWAQFCRSKTIITCNLSPHTTSLETLQNKGPQGKYQAPYWIKPKDTMLHGKVADMTSEVEDEQDDQSEKQWANSTITVHW